MFVPIGKVSQSIHEITKDPSGVIHDKILMGVRYIPLTEAKEQWS